MRTNKFRLSLALAGFLVLGVSNAAAEESEITQTEFQQDVATQNAQKTRLRNKKMAFLSACSLEWHKQLAR